MFADRLKGLRKKVGLTQEDAAKKLDIARTTYSGYERGTSEPDFNTLNKIADFFEVDLNWLITGELRKLNKEDEELVERYSKLSEEDQKYILDLMDRLKK